MMILAIPVNAEINPETLIRSTREAFLEKAFAEVPDIQKESFKVTFVNRDVFYTLPKDVVRTELEFPLRGTVIGRTVIPLVLYDKYNDVVDKVRLITDVDANRTIFRTKRDLKRFEEIKSGDLEAVQASIQSLSYGTVFNDKDIVGKETNTIIHKGDILLHSQIRQKPVIRRGDHLTAILIQEGLTLKLDAVSLDEGQIGDEIRIQTQWKTKKIMKGVILDSSQVKVDIH